MSAQPESRPEPYEVIHLGGEAAAIVPLADLRRLRAVERYAPAEVLEEAEADATLAGHDEWVGAGRPGASRTRGAGVGSGATGRSRSTAPAASAAVCAWAIAWKPSTLST